VNDLRDRNTKPGVSYVRVGSFSGAGIALRDALSSIVDLTDFDALSLSRVPRLAATRLVAMGEARQSGRGTPWNKTAVWSRAVQRNLIRGGIVGANRHTLFIQTLLAPVLEPAIAYSIYTDRVALENVVPGDRFRSRFSRDWVIREQSFLQGASNVFVMGPSTKVALIEQYGLLPQRVHVLGAGPNCAPGSGRTSSTCHNLLFVGIDWERKGGPMLLKVFERARLRNRSLELTIVGGHPAGRIPDGVTVLGRVPHEQMSAVYSKADALVIPTHSEAFGVALVEALTNGIPCIGSTVGNQPWIIGNAGICVEPDSPAGLQKGLTELLERYSDYKTAAEKRASLFKTHMSWKAIAETIAGSILEDRAPVGLREILDLPPS
jgi:glycosyltransferase involved in cell wall biosynthesis